MNPATYLQARDLRVQHVLPAGLVVLFVIVLVRTAWVTDDAFITFRTVDNFLSGYGLRWNVHERVQSFTHPLWFGLLVAANWLTGEIYFTSMVFGMLVSTSVVLLYRRLLSPSAAHFTLVVGLILLSRAFVDFSTSGLENPLTHLLLVLFAHQFASRRHTVHGLRRLFLIAGLAVLNRMDSGLLFAPALLWAARTHGIRATWSAAWRGFAPFALWALFALFYYGSPFPNTAFAKLGDGIDRTAKITSGLTYYANLIDTDPVTAWTIGIGLLLPFLARKRELIPLSMGGLVWMAYVVWIGGDFFAGRMLTPCFLLALIQLALCVREVDARGVTAALTLGICLSFNQIPPILSDSSYGARTNLIMNMEQAGALDQALEANIAIRWVQHRGISDERLNYYFSTGLLSPARPPHQPGHFWVDKGLAAAEEGPQVLKAVAIGMLGYYAGPEVKVIDRVGLADPLLARLPAEYHPDHPFLAGHALRKPPAGYEETVESGINRIEDPAIAEYYDEIALVTQGDLWSLERLSKILELQFRVGPKD